MPVWAPTACGTCPSRLDTICPRAPKGSIRHPTRLHRILAEAMLMSKDVYVLGVSMSRHDRAACLLRNGEVVAAIGEERLDRRNRSIGKYEHQPRNIVL